MTQIKWRQFKDYSGPVAVGTIPVLPPNGLGCAERAYWLTTKVETGGTYGSVVMFDGSAVTAGPDQHILVYPKELANEDFNAADDQGPLGALLARVMSVSALGVDMRRRFLQAGWTLSPTGRFLYAQDRSVQVGGRTIQVKAGGVVHGAVLRDTFTPIGGRVPSSGPQWETASSWAMLLSNLFSDPTTFSTQRLYGQEQLEKSYKSRKFTVEGQIVTPESILRSDIHTASVGPVPEALDLAMAMWYSNSVNAPAIAMKCLEKAWRAVAGSPVKLPAEIIRTLGMSTFGRWNSSISGGRYQRTRIIAQSSRLWSPDFFKVGNIMPPLF
jgi:hypothetical protein